MKLCTKTILMNLFDQDDLLLGLSHQVFCQGCYDRDVYKRQIPSCVPSTSPELETTGGIITCEEMEGCLLYTSRCV